MKFGMLVNGVLHRAPQHIKLQNGDILCTNNPAELLAHGYKPLVTTPVPVLDGYSFSAVWEELESEIRQVWQQHENPADRTAELEEALNILGVETQDPEETEVTPDA